LDQIVFKPIGIIHTPFTNREGMPIQPSGAEGVRGTVEIAPEFAAGLKDLDGFSYIMLIYHFHLSSGYELEVVPFMDDTPRGVFATRAPKRPNGIGVSVVKLLKVEGNVLEVEDLDVIDGTPLLDIKPFVPDIDNREGGSSGWLSGKAMKMRTKKSDGRFR